MTVMCRLQSSRCAYVILLMATFWATESLPSAITALIPMVLMPYLAIASAEDMALNYFSVSIHVL